VVVRTSVTNAGLAQNRSYRHHMVCFFSKVFFMTPSILNKIIFMLLLAAILCFVGYYKLANPKTLKTLLEKDKIYQFIPFMPFLCICSPNRFTKGVAIGLVINAVFILIGNSEASL
jgi:MFS superfamily sulfate permease-like transporter